jgi:hypothetical protein
MVQIWHTLAANLLENLTGESIGAPGFYLLFLLFIAYLTITGQKTGTDIVIIHKKYICYTVQPIMLQVYTISAIM